MTYEQFETSVEGGRPAELYQIVQGPDTFLWTSSEEEITVGGQTFEPVPGLRRGKVGDGEDERKAILEVELPASNTFARRFIGIVPSPKAVFTLMRFHRQDAPNPELVTLFEGLVHSVSFQQGGRLAKMAVQPAISAFVRQIPRWTFQGSCNWVLGDPDTCTVDLDDPAFRLDGTVSDVTGLTITVPGAAAFGDDWFRAGFVEALSGYEFRMVIDHTGDVLTFLLPFPQSVLGQTVTVKAGCDHTRAGAHGCGPKFDNGKFHGAFPYIPDKNPFQGDLP